MANRREYRQSIAETITPRVAEIAGGHVRLRDDENL